MSIQESIQSTSPALGACELRYYGMRRDKEQVIWTLHVETDPGAIMRFLEDVGRQGFRLPKDAKRRAGWFSHKIECWWQYPGLENHRQWKLEID